MVSLVAISRLLSCIWRRKSLSFCSKSLAVASSFSFAKSKSEKKKKKKKKKKKNRETKEKLSAPKVSFFPNLSTKLRSWHLLVQEQNAERQSRIQTHLQPSPVFIKSVTQQTFFFQNEYTPKEKQKLKLTSPLRLVKLNLRTSARSSDTFERSNH